MITKIQHLKNLTNNKHVEPKNLQRPLHESKQTSHAILKVYYAILKVYFNFNEA